MRAVARPPWVERALREALQIQRSHALLIAGPSGLGQFSTLQKVVIGIGDLGPYEPDVTFPGPMDDDAALEECSRLLRPVQEAWTQIGTQVKNDR